MLAVLVIVIIVVLYFGARYMYPPPISKELDAKKEVPKLLPAGDIVVVKKAQFIELKKIEKSAGPANYAGILNIMKLLVYPTADGPPLDGIDLTATASSAMSDVYGAANVLSYKNTTSMWHSKITGDVGEWLRIELSTPMSLDRISIINRPDVSPAGENSRIIGTQVTILDTDKQPIKTYVIGKKGDKIDFIAH